ncbi:cytoplasmic polyadenylated homeobox-like [Choloepus didactylus]|uniref:cytoplasmic polyadenylated homeobox-like n=1 Tax=Choloepus didactylus TaxID=27675 RepID=UPI0018A06F23|nr:cytoplasmic polyadenylated homeobox-like [Choloepus didactylus]
MASNGSPFEEDSHNEEREKKWGKGKGKQRHKFTNEELNFLKEKFEEDPYPDFTTREELAGKVRCHVSVIDNWFQNKRARLPPRERHRIFAARKRHEPPVQGHSLPRLLNVQAEAPKYITEQSFCCAQGYLLDGAGSSFLKKQWLPFQQVDSGGSGIQGIEKEPGYALNYQGDTGKGPSPAYPFPSYGSAVYTQPSTSSMNYFDKDPGAGRSQHASPFLLNSVPNVHGMRKQQEEQNMAHCHYSLLQGQQQNGWGCHLQQHQQPQNFQEKPLFQEQLLKHLGHGNPGQGFPSLQLQQQNQYPQNNGQLLCSQPQQATPQRVVGSALLPLGQDFQQGVAEQSRVQMQQQWDEGSSLLQWSAPQGPEK